MTSWKTTVGGIATALVPTFQAMPYPWAYYVAKALMFLGPLIIGLAARDNDKTSEEVGATTETPSRSVRNIPLLLLAVTLGISLGTLTSCAWYDAHKSQLGATAKVLAPKVEALAAKLIINGISNKWGDKGDNLQSVAVGVGTALDSYFKADTTDIKTVMQIWSPAVDPSAPAQVKAQWQALAEQVAKVYAETPGTTLEKTQAIAAGLEAAADKAKKS
jgi:hypothetical protein